MNIKLVIVGAIIVVLIVMLSPNPIEDRRRAREAALVGKDRLVESINEYNTKTGEFAPSMLGGSTKLITPEPEEAPAPPAKELPSQTNPYTPPSPKPVKTTPPPPEPESYYPPPPLPSGGR